jgi:hypothetical protein
LAFKHKEFDVQKRFSLAYAFTHTTLVNTP